MKNNKLLIAKYKMIAHLIIKYNLKLETICNLSPKDFSKYVDKETKDDIIYYVNKTHNRIKETGFFFYGKTGLASSVASIIAGLRKNLPAEVFKSLHISTVVKHQYVKENCSIDDIINFLEGC